MGTPKEQSKPHTSVEQRISGNGGIGAKVLVTGAGGYLGRHLAAALVRCGADVRALVRDSTRAPHGVHRNIEVAIGNVTDEQSVRDAMVDVDLVVHCAAVTTNNVPWSLHEQTNIEGSRNVLRAAREAGVRRLVHVSSVIVYGLDEPADRRVLPESAPLPPERDRWAFYQRSKLRAERAVSSGPGEDTEVVIVRPGIVYGPGRAGIFERKLVQLGPVRLTLGRGRNHLPLVYVDNAVDAILLALISPAAAGEAYNVVDQPQPKIRTAALEAAAVLREPIRLVPVPRAALASVARLLERRRERAGADSPPRLSRFQIASATRDILYDVSKARDQLGWSSEVSLSEGLQRTFSASA